MDDKSAVNFFGEELLDPTVDPNLSMTIIGEDVPKLTAATIAGLTVVILVAIIAVFLLGVLIDCRQQRVIQQKMEEVKRLKSQRRVNTHAEDDKTNITQNMEETGLSLPPLEAIRHIP